MTKALDLTGQRFGRLVAEELLEPIKKRTRWRCVCDCGTSVVVLAQLLRNGDTRSCGCLRAEMPSPARTHGASDSPEFSVWSSMRRRCNDAKNPAFPNYGGRGITVCSAWDASFEAFYRDVGPRPAPEFSLDRIDNDGNYEPGNIRWATRQEQAQNRRLIAPITIDGVTKSLAAWAASIGVTRRALVKRMAKGMTAEQAVHVGKGRYA